MEKRLTGPLKRTLHGIAIGSVLLIFCAAVRAETKPFELLDGDRVVFVGGTLIEREGQLGYIEMMMTLRFPDRHVTFRNLGQSGDTVMADARNLNAGFGVFGPPEQGFNRLKKLIEEIKPTVIFANYGMTESFEGKKKLLEFVKGYEQLLDMMTQAAGGTPRVVLISPNYHQDLGRPLPSPEAHNRDLESYRDAIEKIAADRRYRFVDLFGPLAAASSNPKEVLMENGIHPNTAGYRRIAAIMGESLGWGRSDEQLGPKGEQLRKMIVAKNLDFFHYWRPENDTYILGYRKKEQGRNAVELPQFLPLVEEKEKQIAKLRVSK